MILTLGSCYDGNFDEGCAMLLKIIFSINNYQYLRGSTCKYALLSFQSQYTLRTPHFWQTFSEYFRILNCSLLFSIIINIWVVHLVKVCHTQLLKLVYLKKAVFLTYTRVYTYFTLTNIVLEDPNVLVLKFRIYSSWFQK